MSRTGGLSLPITFIVLQVIYGKPLRDKKQFQTCDIEEFLGECNSTNLQNALGRLLELGLLTANKTTVSMQGTRGGNPVRKVYTRTAKGETEYKQLVRQLKPCGILFR